MTGFPVVASAIGSTTREAILASSVTSLSPLTTTIEIAAIGASAAIKWASNQATSVITAAGTANFDNIVPVGTVRQFVVPKSTQGAMGSVVGIGTVEGLFPGIATMGIGAAVGSVLLTQY